MQLFCCINLIGIVNGRNPGGSVIPFFARTHVVAIQSVLIVQVLKLQAQAMQKGWLKHEVRVRTMYKINKNTQCLPSLRHISYAADNNQFKLIKLLTMS